MEIFFLESLMDVQYHLLLLLLTVVGRNCRAKIVGRRGRCDKFGQCPIARVQCMRKEVGRWLDGGLAAARHQHSLRALRGTKL